MWIFFIKILIVILYVAGFLLLIRGFRRYKIQFAWILIAFLGPFPIFLVYEWKRRSYLRKGQSHADRLQIADRRVRISIWYIVLSYIMMFGSQLYAYYNIMDGGAAPLPMMTSQLQIQAIGITTLSIIYGLIIYIYQTQGSRR